MAKEDAAEERHHGDDCGPSSHASFLMASVKWGVVYERAIRDDGSLLFPERLTREFLDQMRRSMGSYLFANQYQNECIPDSEKRFKKDWIRYLVDYPKETFRFAFIDPAIGQNKHHDFTGTVVVDTDLHGNWYVRYAARQRLTPTEIVQKMFQIQKEFECKAIGVEIVAYQEALLYILDQEMKRRQIVLPVKGIKRSATSKETRILGLVPKFEWGRIYLAPGLKHLEDELLFFPRAQHDDLLDALASLDELVFYPQPPKIEDKEPAVNDPRYESWFIKNLMSKKSHSQEESDYD